MIGACVFGGAAALALAACGGATLTSGNVEVVIPLAAFREPVPESFPANFCRCRVDCRPWLRPIRNWRQVLKPFPVAD